MATADISIYGKNPLRSVADFESDMNAVGLQRDQLRRNQLDFADRPIKAAREAEKALVALEQEKAQTAGMRTTAQQTAVETAGKVAARYKDALPNVTNPQQLAAWYAQQYADPILSPVMNQTHGPLLKTLSEIPDDPAQFEAMKMKIALGMKGYVEAEEKKATLAQTIANATRQAAHQEATLKETARGHDLTADRAEEDRKSRETQARLDRESRERVARMPARAQADDDAVELNEQSVVNAAARYNMDGTLPPNLGRGAQGAKNTARILNEAARIAGERGDTPEAQRIAQIANKATTSALTQLQKQESMVGAFERNFTKNADLAIELSNKTDRTGIPIVNKWINVGKRAVTGDVDLVKFDAVVKSVSNEFAKIISGSMGNTAVALAEIKKIESLLNAAQTPEQVKAVIDTMKRETANRIAGFDEEKKKLKTSLIPEGKKADAAKPDVSAKRVKFETLK